MDVVPDIVWVLAGPSGSGKTTLARALAARSGGRVRRARTCTTRPLRPDETPDSDYRFVSDREFAALRDRGDLLEETAYDGHRYGVPAGELSVGGEVVVVVDPAGIRHLRARFGNRVVAICLAGHSADDLAARLAGRGSSPDEVEARMRNLAEEAAALAAACAHRIAPGAPEDVLEAVEVVMDRERRLRRAG